MANKPLQSIKFPGLSDTYTVPQVDNTLTQTGQAADAKKVGDEITGLKEDLEQSIKSIKPGLSTEAKNALLTCLEKLAWKDGDGRQYIMALKKAMADVLTLLASEFEHFTMWYNKYPYTGATNTRLAYHKFDIETVGGEIYDIKSTVNGQNINLRVDIYNQAILEAYNNKEDITSHANHRYATGGWDSVNQQLVMPKAINGSPTAGIVCIFRHSDDSDISTNEIESVTIEQVLTGEVPYGYTEYDYISMNGTGAVTASDYTAFIKTIEYDDLADCSISADFLAKTTIGTANLPIFGGRQFNNWENVVCLYVINGTNTYSLHYHGVDTLENAFPLGEIVHVDIRRTDASPKIFVTNGTRKTLEWKKDTVVNCALSLFALNIKGSNSPDINFSNNIQLGQLTIVDSNGNADVYVPVVRNADNVIGIYNKTKKVFSTCQDVAKATVGNTNCLYQVGNWNL